MADLANLLTLVNLTAEIPWLEGIRSELKLTNMFTSSQRQSTGGESHLHEYTTILSASKFCLNLVSRTWFETLAPAFASCKSPEITLDSLDIL